MRRRMAKGLGLLALAVDGSQEPSDRSELDGKREHLQSSATERAEHRIDLEHFANELSPRDSATLQPTIAIFILARVATGDF